MTAPTISAKSNENMDVITFQTLANIFGNFRKYPEISGNIKFPESLQPYQSPRSSPQAVMRCFCVMMSSRFARTAACDGQTYR